MPLRAFVAFDCETTGLDPREDVLLQLAACVVEPGGRRTWSTLVDPGRPVRLQIQRLTGITSERLVGAPAPASALAGFRAVVGDLPLVAHNASFDTAFVQAGLERAGLPPLTQDIYDTLELARLVEPAGAGHKLSDLIVRRGIESARAHDALADAVAAASLFADLLADLGRMDPVLLGTLAHFLGPVPGPLGRLVRTMAGGRVQAEMRLTALPDIQERRRPDGALVDVAGLLSPGSPLAERLAPFEPRPGQAEMLAAVGRALASGRHLVVEAGTGTGKSMAYLLPALAWARRQGRRVVVATRTVNLQEQLVGKDLPMIRQSGALEADVALLKGRSHYACLKLWQERLGEAVDPASGPFLARFARWLAQTETGDRGELGLYGEDEERFASLSADAVACTGRHCPFFEPCYLFRARRKAEQADLIVANYALVFSDLNTDGAVLPEYDYLICDEAHHLEDEAANHLGRVVGERALERFFRLLARGGGSGLVAGMAAQLEGALEPEVGQVRSWLQRAMGHLAFAQEVARDCFEGLRAWAAARDRGGYTATVRFEPRPAAGSDVAWDRVSEAGRALILRLRELGEALAAAVDAAEGSVTVSPERLAELGATAASAGEWARALEICLDGQEGWVTWCELAQRRDGAGAVTLRAAPVDTSGILREALFSQKRAVVLTSATLSVRGRFSYLRGRLGLAGGQEGDRTDELRVAAPFDYPRQALLLVPRDLPQSAGVSPQQHARALAPWLLELFTRTRGHALLLFTANRLMREVRNAIAPALEREGIACLAQGVDGSRNALADALRRNEETVVLGAASFWEGVDVPGPGLRCLVIAQLPFWPPDMPLQQARQDAIRAAGGNPFRDLQLPQAVLRFQQGFGRLVRSAGDRGVAIVLDARVVSQRYGAAFLDSLPGPARAVASAAEVLEQVTSWLG